MKYIKPPKALAFIVAPILFFIGLIFFCHFTRFVSYYFNGLWIATLSAFLLVMTPLGNRRLSQNGQTVVTRLSMSQWITRIVLLELVLLGVFLGITDVSGNALTVNTTLHPNLFSQSLQAELLHAGLFPWSLYAVIAAGIGILAYRQQHNAYFSDLLYPVIKTDVQSILGLIVNVGARRITLCGIGLTLTFFPILIINLFLIPEKHIAVGFQPVALFVTLLLFFSTISDTIKSYWMRLFSRHIPTYLSLPVFAFILALTIILLGVMIAGIIPKTNQATPLFIQNWIDFHWQTAWTVFSIMWWLALTPAVCMYITRISYGYKIRDVILCVLTLPILITLWFLYFHSNFILLSEKWIPILSVLSFLIALPLLVNYQNLTPLIAAYYPKSGENKTRDHHPFFRKMIQFCIIGLYFYLVIGINGISILIFALNYFWVMTIFISCVAVVRNSVGVKPGTKGSSKNKSYSRRSV